MTEIPVLVVGAGPIGLVAAILLKQQGVDVLVIDEKADFSDHPRARFMDSCTLELFRQIGIADEVEQTGIGPVWTKTVNCFTTFSEAPIAKVPSPEFHSVPRPITPQVPVMTCQDLLEPVIYKRVLDLGIEVRLNASLTDLAQDDEGCSVTVKDMRTGDVSEIRADYVIGADGARSPVRSLIGCELVGEARDTYYRDVLFHADLSPWIADQNNQGALLWTAHSNGAGMYQPLDGGQRFRAQIAGLDPEEEFDDDYFKAWIRASMGPDANFPIEIFSKLVWRVGARSANRFSVGRVFLAGDAAHIFTPTGGMGMNTAFAGVRNLAWKLAYAVKGLAAPEILDTYDSEWRPQANWRQAVALENHDYIVGVYRAHFTGEDVKAPLHAFEQYTDYPGVIFGYEIESPLVAEDSSPAPDLASPVRNYIPSVRAGRRAPHLWLDEAQTQSILDWFGTDYVVVLGPDAGEQWDTAVRAAAERGFPVRLERLTEAQAADSPYAGETAIVVRPDLIVAGHCAAGEEPAAALLLDAALPQAA